MTNLIEHVNHMEEISVIVMMILCIVLKHQTTKMSFTKNLYWLFKHQATKNPFTNSSFGQF